MVSRTRPYDPHFHLLQSNMAEAGLTLQPKRKFFPRLPVGPTEQQEELSVSPSPCTPKREGKFPFIIGVAGGTASGKTSLCRKIMEALERKELSASERRVVVINQDRFYRELNEEESARAAKGEYNFDHPDAFDNELMKQSVLKLCKGQKVDLPVYDFKTNTRSKTEKETVYQADVILLEGILVLYNSEIRHLMELKLFVDTDNDTRLARRIQRDIRERGRTPNGVIEQYLRHVKPAFDEFILPTKVYADLIVPGGTTNDVATHAIVHRINTVLEGRKKTANTSTNRTNPVSDSPRYSFEDSAEFSFDSVFM